MNEPLTIPTERVRWQKVEALYHSAMAMDVGKRADWLVRECDDEGIRQDVLSLIESSDLEDSFLEEPAFSLGLALIDRENEALIGEQIDRYKIIRRLGRGGMGDVYLAEDPRLARLIALKMLPSSITEDHERIRRFQHEARAASAISHPNVAHVYEIGEAAGRHYIAMEYVKGPTLRQVLRNQTLAPERAVEIAIQVASALVAAHRARIIHRDVKPENIIFAETGFIKVLDFGLAKLVQEPGAPNQTDAQSISSIHTAPELLVGTAHYMSPEQIRRRAPDQRTDLWSLGVVIFEMLTSRRPFPGETFSDVIVAIIEQEPLFTNSECSRIPETLRAAVTRALNKDLQKRYQSAEELLSNLRMVQQSTQSVPGGPNLSAAAAQFSIETPATGSFDGEAATAKPYSVRSNTIAQRLDTVKESGTSPPFPSFLSIWRVKILPIVVVLAAAAAYFQISRMRHVTLAEVPINLKFERLNLSGNIDDITLSPDGKYVAAIVQEAGNYAIHISELATGSDLRVANPRSEGYSGLSFSADGTYLYYIEDLAYSGVLNRVSKFGGGQRKIAENVNTRPAFSPDGKQIVFMRLNRPGEPAQLVMASAEGDSQRVLSERTLADTDFFFSDRRGPGPVWSPDGQSVACATRGTDLTTASVNVELLSPVTGAGKRINVKPWQDISRMTWLSDSSGLVVAAKDSKKSPWQLRLLSVPSGRSRDLTIDPNNYTAITGAADSKSFVTINSEDQSNVWFVDTVNGPHAVTVMPATRNGVSEVFWNADSTLIVAAGDGSNTNLWMEDVTGSSLRQLTFGTVDHFNPAATRDRRYILFVSGGEKGTTISRMDTDGANVVQLTTGPADTMPSIAPDGTWFVYRTAQGLNKMSIEGGTSKRLWDKEGFSPTISPDGQLLSFFTSDRLDSEEWYLAVMDIRTMSQVARLELPDATDPFGNLSWTPAGDGLTYISSAGGAANIWLQPLNGRPSRQLTDFKEATINSFTWSPDGKTIACVRRVKVFIPMLVRLY